MKKDDILYIGFWVDPEAIKALLQGTPFEGYVVKPESHMTVAFRPDKERLSELLPHLGQEITLTMESIGTLHKNGILCNIGLKSNADNLGVFMPETTPHITVWIITQEKNKAGKLIAKAFETFKCKWDNPISADLVGRLAVFNGKNEWDFSVQ